MGTEQKVSQEESEKARAYLLARIVIDRAGCWLWQLRKDKDGYGKMEWKGESWRVHRFSYHYLVGYLSKGTVVHHSCATRDCCNPQHLLMTTHHDNVAEMLGRNYLQEEIANLRQEITELREAMDNE